MCHCAYPSGGIDSDDVTSQWYLTFSVRVPEMPFLLYLRSCLTLCLALIIYCLSRFFFQIYISLGDKQRIRALK
jgi:hypothetical protein